MATIQASLTTENYPSPVSPLEGNDEGATSRSQNICCYVNASSKVQILRIANVRNWYFERVVFPGQRLVFEAPLLAMVEIHTAAIAGAILADKIPCERLQIAENSSL